MLLTIRQKERGELTNLGKKWLRQSNESRESASIKGKQEDPHFFPTLLVVFLAVVFLVALAIYLGASLGACF